MVLDANFGSALAIALGGYEDGSLENLAYARQKVNKTFMAATAISKSAAPSKFGSPHGSVHG